MTREWARWCRAAKLSVEGDDVDVQFPDGRHHIVHIEDDDDEFRLVGIVARRSVVDELERIALRLWQLNRVTQLVGFRIDERQRILGEVWVPKPGLSAEEFVFYVQHVAATCDRLEYLLTGIDRE